MVVTSRCFAFRALITRADEFENVFEFKTRQVYFIYPFLRRLKLGKSLQTNCVIFFSLKLTFNREKSVFWNFFQTSTDYACKTSCTDPVQDFATQVRISLLISAITKSFAFFLAKFIL